MLNTFITLYSCEIQSGRRELARRLAELWSDEGKTVLLVTVGGTIATPAARTMGIDEARSCVARFKSLSPLFLTNYLKADDSVAQLHLTDWERDEVVMKDLWNLLHRTFDRTLVLAPADKSPEGICLLDASDLLLWVARPGRVSAERLQQGLKDLAADHFPNSFSQVLLNRLPNRSFKSNVNPEIVLGKPVLAAFPEDQSPRLRLQEQLRRLAKTLDSDPAFYKNKDVAPANSNSEKLAGDLRNRVQPELMRALEKKKSSTDPVSQSVHEAEIAQKTVEACLAEETTLSLSREERGVLYTRVMEDVLGLGPIEPLLKDPQVTEVMVNGHGCVYVERKGKLYSTDVRFTSESQLRTVIDRIVAPIGRRVDESMPLCDARLSDGSRVNIVLPPLALDGPVVTIRKFMTHRLSLDELIEKGSMNQAMADFLTAAVVGCKNIVVSGGTGSGKTTLLNALSSVIPDDQRIVTIEDAAELRLQKPHVIRLESRPANAEGQGAIPIRQLVINALRMRPDRIVVGECRGGEALDMLQAMNTGHDGSLTTLHANTPRDALARLETLVLMAGMDLPVRVVREQIRGAVQIILQQSRMADGSRKVTSITELIGLDVDVLLTQELFRYRNGTFESTGLPSITMETNRRSA